MRLETIRLLEDERLQVLEQDAAEREEHFHRVRVAERQVPFEQEPVEAGERPRRRRRVLREKLPHAHLPLVDTDEVANMHDLRSTCQALRTTAASRRRWGGFGCGREAAL